MREGVFHSTLSLEFVMTMTDSDTLGWSSTGRRNCQFNIQRATGQGIANVTCKT